MIYVGGEPEPFTSGLISADAHRSYAKDHPEIPLDHYEPVRARGHYGYKMFAWESQIAMARACGRGTRSGKGLAPHPFDIPT